jgi:hypothetical protein
MLLWFHSGCTNPNNFVYYFNLATFSSFERPCSGTFTSAVSQDKGRWLGDKAGNFYTLITWIGMRSEGKSSTPLSTIVLTEPICGF